MRPPTGVAAGKDRDEFHDAVGVGGSHAAQVVLVADGTRIHRIVALPIRMPEIDSRTGERLAGIRQVEDGHPEPERNTLGGAGRTSETAPDVVADDPVGSQRVGAVGAVSRIGAGCFVRDLGNARGCRRRCGCRGRGWRRGGRGCCSARRGRGRDGTGRTRSGRSATGASGEPGQTQPTEQPQRTAATQRPQIEPKAPIMDCCDIGVIVGGLGGLGALAAGISHGRPFDRGVRLRWTNLCRKASPDHVSVLWSFCEAERVGGPA